MNIPDSAPLVSVIIPTIEFDFYTEDALKSILHQTYENWEIILVLDGAPPVDIPEWVMGHPQITIVVHQIRLGTPISLNDGARAAAGELIARLDADDIAHPERLRIQVNYLQTHPEAVCVGTSTLIIDADGNLISGLIKESTENDVRCSLLVKNQLVHSSVMYRKSAFEHIGGYNPIMKRSQDYDLYLRLGRIGPVALLHQSLCAYRVHLGQHSRKTSPFARYTFEILRQRGELSRSLGSPVYKQIFRNLMWYSAQIIRHSGIRKPRYIKGEGIGSFPAGNLDWLQP